MSEHIEPKPKTVKIPGPDHPISVERNASRVVVTVAGRIVADTRKALTLREASYPPVQYIPRKDVDMTLLAQLALPTLCSSSSNSGADVATKYGAGRSWCCCSPMRLGK